MYKKEDFDNDNTAEQLANVGIVGRIVEGDDAGSYVKVLDDSENTGGYIILTSSHHDMSDGFDNWVQDRESLSAYFEESRWVVNWGLSRQKFRQKLDLETVRRVFRDVLDRRMTREAADRWAYGLVQQSEAGTLTYSPITAKDRIWEGVMYLYGIDILEAPGKYLHTNEEIRLAMVVKLGG